MSASRCVTTTRPTVSWHRNEQRNRRRDRTRLHKLKARGGTDRSVLDDRAEKRLADHHGSQPPTMGADDGCTICGKMDHWRASCPGKGGKGGTKGKAQTGGGPKGGSKGRGKGSWMWTAAADDASKPCRDSARHGCCGWGESCKFAHAAAAVVDKPKNFSKCTNCQAMFYLHRINDDGLCTSCKSPLPVEELPKRIQALLNAGEGDANAVSAPGPVGNDGNGGATTQKTEGK